MNGPFDYAPDILYEINFRHNVWVSKSYAGIFLKASETSHVQYGPSDLHHFHPEHPIFIWTVEVHKGLKMVTK